MTQSVKKRAYRVIPGDVIRIPNVGFRSVTETEYNLVDNSVVLTCGTEDVVHEVAYQHVLTVYGTLPPSGRPDTRMPEGLKVATFLACVLVFCLIVGVVIGQ